MSTYYVIGPPAGGPGDMVGGRQEAPSLKVPDISVWRQEVDIYTLREGRCPSKGRVALRAKQEES